MQLQLAFVDSIVANPTVRLNLHSTIWETRDGSRFDPPPLRRAISESLLADGAMPSASAYGNRTIVLMLALPSDYTDDQAANQMQTLMRELDRESNLLRYQPGTAVPVFFRTFRTAPDALDFDPINKTCTVQLLAEPFGYGLEETLAGSAVSNNPASGLFFDISSPKGDVETPLYLTVSNGVVGTGRRVSALAVRRRGTVSATPLVLQAEAMTQGTDTSIQANSAVMSGAGSNYCRTTFATQAGLTRRLTTNTRHPSTASVDARGTYRVLARMRQNTAADLIDVRLVWGGADSPVVNPVVRVTSGDTNLKYVDLGRVQIPVGYDPVTRGPNGVELATEGIYLGVDVRRATGSGTVDIDALVLLPADDRQMFVKWPAAATVTDFVVEGGPAPAVYARNASQQLTSTEQVEVSAGGGLMITPGRTNRVFFVRDVGWSAPAAGTGDDITASTTLTPSYFPRYLRPATT